MKTLIATFALCASMCSLGGILQYELACGTNETSYAKIPGGSAQIVSFETAMTDASVSGNASLSIGRTIVGNLVHTDMTTNSVTNVVAQADTLVNNYEVTATFTADGMNNWVQSSIFSNCYANTTKTGTYANTNGTSRIVLSPGNGSKTLTQPTDFYIGLTFFEDNRWSTNFTWAADQSEISFSSGSGNPWYAVSIKRHLPYMVKPKIVTNVVTTVSTNIWNERVSRMVTIPVVESTALSNGYLMATPATNAYIFAGDKIICTAPIADDKPGIVRAILKQ